MSNQISGNLNITTWNLCHQIFQRLAYQKQKLYIPHLWLANLKIGIVEKSDHRNENFWQQPDYAPPAGFDD